MELTVLYPHTKSKFIAKYLLYQHKIKWIKIGEKIPEAPLLVTAGGDGTIHYAVNRINLDKTKLLVLPLGRGNAFARIFNLPIGLLSDKDILTGQELEVQLLEVNNRLAIFATGMGKGGEVMHYANPYSQFGFPSYILSTLKSIQTTPAYSFTINNNLYPDLLTVEISLWGMAGYGLPFTNSSTIGPYLTMIKGNPLMAAFKFLLGQFPDWEGAKTIKGEAFTLKTEEEINAHIDGENFLTRYLEVKLSPKKVNIIKPQVSLFTNS
ncbi:MAG: putative lipid kinase BmrU [candidate division WS2 bacterium]|nr:putative lipid kinase BmrU [Candidatus Psychracetigena formicireducens]